MSGELVLPNTITAIGRYAFYGCTGLTSIKIPNSVYYIRSQAFSKTSLTSIIIPNSVGYIEGSPFRDCVSLKTVYIGKGVATLSNYAFGGSDALETIIVDPANTHYDSRNNSNAIIEKSTNELVAGCKTTVIPNSVTSIGSTAFYDIGTLTSITIPNSVTSIGSQSFSYTGLTSITIPSSVISIEYAAFQGCRSLASITIPSNVTSIGQLAFSGCSSLTSITIPNSVTSIGDSAFSFSGLTSITIPSNVTSIGQNAFRSCDSLSTVTFSNRNNWFVSTAPAATSGTNLTLTNTSTNATYLKDTYRTYYWKRSQ